MATLMLGASTCPLCGRAFEADDRVFGTWGVFLPEDDPLFRFCDAPIHWACYATWPDRSRFARAYFDMWVNARDLNEFWGTAFLSESVLVQVNPSPPVEEAEVILAATGSRLRTKMAGWDVWVSNPADSRPDLHPLDRSALAEVLPALREALPTAAAVVDRSDWRAKQERARGHRAERRKRNHEKQQREREAKRHRPPDGSQ